MMVAVLVLASCSPKSAVIPSDPAHWDQISDRAKHLSDDDRRLLAAYLMRESMGSALAGGKPSIPPGTTIGQAIADQKKFEADLAKQGVEAEILKAKAAAQRATAEAALDNAALVTLVSKSVLPQNIDAERFNDRVNFVIAIQNKTLKDISGVKGTLEFDDMFGTEIKSFSLSIDNGVKAGQIATTSDYGFDVNQFENPDTQIAQTDLAKMKVTFHPEMIVFSDGTKMVTPTDTSAPG